MKKVWPITLLGILASNLVALTIVLLISLIVRRPGPAGATYLYSTFTLIPILMGFLLELFRQSVPMTRVMKINTSVLNLAVAYGLCWAALHEGAICLVMASPLVLLFHTLGVLIAGRLSLFGNSSLNASVIPLLLVFIAADVLSPHVFQNSEADRIVIHARPEVVWRYVVEYPANRRPVDYWLWRMGLPAPVRSTATAHAVGAKRLCEFTGGVAAEERITAIEPGRRLAFDVTSQPDHPEVVGHFTLERGEFLLTDNGDGTTTLTGTSWYSLHVFPSQYYDVWVQDIVRRVHVRVMGHVKALAEADRTPD